MSDRIEVKKTYKTYIGGNFPRTESGWYYKVKTQDDNLLVNICRCSPKDVRNAVSAARKAFSGWSERSAYNRGQILYRTAEMLETRKAQFIESLKASGLKKKQAVTNVEASVDRLIYYAGWSDKYQQIFGSINPVASSHFNFSRPDPCGVVNIWAPETSPLLGLVSVISPVIVGGNTCVVLASHKHPLTAIEFAEVLHSSDVPGGVVNILTGFREELLHSMTSHMDVNAFLHTEVEMDQEIRKQMDEYSALNLKRITHKPVDDWNSGQAQSPYLINDFQEIKTTWHPIGY